MLKRAINKIKRNKIRKPSEGMFSNILYEDSRRGHWQVEYAYDLRINKNPFIAVYYFKGHNQLARSADYVLTKEYTSK